MEPLHLAGQLHAMAACIQALIASHPDRNHFDGPLKVALTMHEDATREAGFAHQLDGSDPQRAIATMHRNAATQTG